MNLSPDDLRHAYRQMRTIRAFEEKLNELVKSGKLGGFLHLYAGEEAVAVGVCSHLGDGDFVASTHRGHGHCIARGVDPAGMMAELFGRATGLCKGKSGSMHIADVEKGMQGHLALSSIPGELLPFTVEKLTPISTSADGRNFFRVEASLGTAFASLRPGMEGVGKIGAGDRRLIWLWTHDLLDWLRLWLWLNF